MGKPFSPSRLQSPTEGGTFTRIVTPPHFIHAVIAGIAIFGLSGCASLISGRHADVAIRSSPADANVSVFDKHGRMVAAARTPAVVTVKRGDGFLKKAEYTATIEKPGYHTAHVPIRGRLNPWLFGNVLFGGVAGLIVDPYTGAMWRPTPKDINAELEPSVRPGPQLYPASHAEAPKARLQ